MAHINHYYREEKVWEECCDRGIKFEDYVTQNVEHYTCSECGKEVSKSSKFCPECGAKFNKVKEEYKTITCAICGTKEKMLAHKDGICCSDCALSLHCHRDYIELAKIFYQKGLKKGKEK